MEAKRRLEAITEVARRYDYNAAHSHQVECLAGTLFMELTEVHNLAPTDRKLLEYAAILHDIGYYVSAAGHHRHALMMILTEPLTEFTREEVKIIANVARYHRKALPSTTHTMFGVLSEADRYRVSAMAALLRIADVLDHSKQAVVSELTCDVTPDAVKMHVIAKEEMKPEMMALSRRGDLFREVFKRTPLLEVKVA